MNLLLLLTLLVLPVFNLPTVESNKIQKRSIIDSIQSLLEAPKKKILEMKRKRRVDQLRRKINQVETDALATEYFLLPDQPLSLFIYSGGFRSPIIGNNFKNYKTRLEQSFISFLTDYFDFYQLDYSTPVFIRYSRNYFSYTRTDTRPPYTRIYIGQPFYLIGASISNPNPNPIHTIHDNGNLAFMIHNYRYLDQILGREGVNPLNQWNLNIEGVPRVSEITIPTTINPILVISQDDLHSTHSTDEIKQKLESKYKESPNAIEECPICQKQGTTHKSTCCQQCFHRDCVEQWWTKLPSRVPLSCPICRNTE